EYLADAGAVELTKNPDAMIGALRKIAGHSEISAPSQVQEMFLDHPASRFSGLFSTHPSIDDRIAALVKFGGGREAIAAAGPELPESSVPEFGRRDTPPTLPPSDGAGPSGPWSAST